MAPRFDLKSLPANRLEEQMAVEKIVMVKRTLYVAKCSNCGDSKEVDAHPPRERRCTCGTWVPYEEISYTGQELGK